MKNICLILSLFLVFTSCTPKISNNITKEVLVSKFYQVFALSKAKKEKIYVSDKKEMNLFITNHGTKDLFIPNTLENSNTINSQLKIELFKIIDKEVKAYRSSTYTNTQEEFFKGKVHSIKNGEKICIKNIQIDKFNKIKEPGKFYAKITIDLSDYGYFKKINSDLFFEVIN